MDEFDGNDDFDATSDCDDDMDGDMDDLDSGSVLDSSDFTADDVTSCGLYDGDDGQMILAAFADTPVVVDAGESLITNEEEIAILEENTLPLEEDMQLDGQLDIEEYEQIQYAISQTPALDSAHGYWTGYRGMSTFVPTDEEPRAVLDQLGLEGIPYVEGYPSFDDVSACNIILTPEEMELSDAQHKQMLIDTYRDNEEELNQKLLDAFLREDADTFATELDMNAIHPRFCAHHTTADDEGNYHLQAIPDVFHNLNHMGGRAESGTQGKRH